VSRRCALHSVARVAAVLATAACASAPAAPIAGPGFEAQIEAASAWRKGFLVDPAAAALSACAHLPDGPAAFNGRLTGVGFAPAPRWTGDPSGYLSIDPFVTYRGAQVSLRLTANHYQGVAVCTIWFVGPLGPAAWEDFRRQFAAGGPLNAASGQAPSAERRFVKEAGSETTVLVFTQANRRDPPGLMMEVRRADRADGR
jgi:hypothetical protein